MELVTGVLETSSSLPLRVWDQKLCGSLLLILDAVDRDAGQAWNESL